MWNRVRLQIGPKPFWSKLRFQKSALALNWDSGNQPWLSATNAWGPKALVKDEERIALVMELNKETEIYLQRRMLATTTQSSWWNQMDGSREREGRILTFTNILPSQVNFLSSISPPVGSNLVKMASNRIEANLGSVVYNKTWDKNWKIFAEHLIGLKTASLSFLNPFTFFCHYHKLSDSPQCQEVTLGRSTIRCTEWKWKKLLKITIWAEKNQLWKSQWKRQTM